MGNWEEFVRTGGWDVGRTPPLALGVEAAGVVVDVGPGVEWPAVGASVMTHPLPLPYQGCWAERLVAPARLVAEKPDNASWAEAAAFPVPALTAEQVVSEALDVQPGETILVNGAGRRHRRDDRRARGEQRRHCDRDREQEQRGARDVARRRRRPRLSRSRLDSRAMRRRGSSGIRAAANAAGGGEADALSTLVDGGRLATITGAPPPEERGISIANVIVRPDGDELRLLAASLADGKLHVDIGASYPLTRAAEALAHAIKGSRGAVVLEP